MAHRAEHRSSSPRQRAIVEAALACFAEKGYFAATVEAIRARCGASIGSMYHHFGGKEQIAAAVYVEGLSDYQAGLLERLRRVRGARAGVAAIVTYHLTWVESHPDWARFLLTMRHAEFMKDAEDRIQTANKIFLGRVLAWINPHVATGALRRLPGDVFMACVIGPAQEFSRLWLLGRARTPLAAARRFLSNAAWQAVRGTKQ